MNTDNTVHEKVIIDIPERFGGMRADVVFSELLKEYSRAQIARFLRSEMILVDGLTVKPSRILSGGETASFTPPPDKSHEPLPQEIPLDIIHEDSDIVVLNKPPGTVVHPGAGVEDGTLVNALLHHYPEIEYSGERQRPGIVHRLDKETSGIMVVARNMNAYRSLVRQFKNREVFKEYRAIIRGEPDTDSGQFVSSIGRHRTSRIRMSSKTDSGKHAITLWSVIRRYGGYTFVIAVPKTGRTHQIRVHFAEAGLPLIGDRLYGKGTGGSVTEAYGMKRHALHSAKIGFVHPASGVRVEFCAPIPEDMEAAIKKLESRI